MIRDLVNLALCRHALDGERSSVLFRVLVFARLVLFTAQPRKSVVLLTSIVDVDVAFFAEDLT